MFSKRNCIGGFGIYTAFIVHSGSCVHNLLTNKKNYKILGSFKCIVDLKHINFHRNRSIFEVIVFQIFKYTGNFLMTGNGQFKDLFEIDREYRNCIDPYPLEIDWMDHFMHSMCPILEHFLHFIVLGTLQSLTLWLNSNLKQPLTFWSETRMESLPLSP